MSLYIAFLFAITILNTETIANSCFKNSKVFKLSRKGINFSWHGTELLMLRYKMHTKLFSQLELYLRLFLLIRQLAVLWLAWISITLKWQIFMQNFLKFIFLVNHICHRIDIKSLFLKKISCFFTQSSLEKK